MHTRVLGGEAGRRGFFGRRANRPRLIGLLIVAALGAVATIMLRTTGLALTAVGALLVFAATTGTHHGSVLARRAARRRWAERLDTGTVAFVPVGDRPPGLSERTDPDAVRAWNTYRDWPDGAEGMYWLQRDRGRPGIAWHAPTGEDAYLSVAFAVDGAIRGVADDRFLDTAATAFGDLLARYGSPTSLANRVQMLTRVVPVDSAFHEAWVWDALDWDTPDNTAGASGHEALVASYDEVVRRVAAGGLAQRHYVAVRWPLTSAFTAAAARRGPAQAGWRALMAAEIDTVTSHLRAARLGEVTALSAAQLAAVLRHLQHPSWPIDQAVDVDVDAPWVACEDEWSATRTYGPGPEDGPSSDGAAAGVQEWWHRTAVVPIEAVETGPRTPLWLGPLLWGLPHPIIRTLSIQIEIVPAAVARHGARTDLTADLADLAAQREKGVLTDDELTVALAAARGRLDDLAPGSGHHGAAWVAHLSITAPTRADLLEATAKISEAAGDAGITHLHWCDTQQAAAMACCWPIARGMAPVPAGPAAGIRGLLAGSGAKESM